jgi:tetratricopeptide (TPR) repeat protein
METRQYRNYHASFVFEDIGDENKAGVINFWKRTHALPPDESADRRVGEVAIIVRESVTGIVVAVNSIFQARLNPEGEDYYVYRIFIDPAHRVHNLIGFMTRFAYEELNQRHRPGSPRGLCFFTDNQKLQRPGVIARLKRSGWEQLGKDSFKRDLWHKLFISNSLSSNNIVSGKLQSPLYPRHATRPMTAEIQVRMQQALVACNHGQLVDAREMFEEIVSHFPDSADALHMLGVIAYQGEEYQRAVAVIGEAIALNPGNAAYYSDRGLALQKLKQLEVALEHYDKAISIQPDLAITYLNRGNVLKALGQQDSAVESYQKAAALLEKKHDSSDALHMLGLMAFDRKEYQRSVDLIDKAIAINPDNAAYYSDRGLALQRLKHLDQALESYDTAIAIRKDIAIIHLNRGNALKELRLLDAAIESYDNAIAIKPDYATAYWNKALEQLTLGDFDQGWKSYEWRWKEESFPSPRRNFPWPLWLGEESLRGKTILLHSEQGLGDTIQFCRYVPLVAALGARVVLEVEKPLFALLEQLEGVSAFVAKGLLLPAVDCHAPLLSLPLAFKTNLATIPASQKYLISDPLKVAEWERRLGSKSMPRIGLAWSGRAEHQNDHLRSISLAELIEHLPPGLQYVSLQKEVRPADCKALDSHTNIAHFGEALQDFTDTAALIELVDVVISVDTSVAHLSAASGKSTWVLLPFTPDWRWLLDRNDSPWYQSVKLYRQETAGDWHGVLDRVMYDLFQTLKQ